MRHESVSPSRYIRPMFDLSPFVAAAILSMESQTWLLPGVKESAARARLGVSMVRYTQLLNALLDTELALQLDPMTTNRLRTIRARRQLSRSARRSA